MKCQVALINGYLEVYLSGHVKYEVHMTTLDYCLNKPSKATIISMSMSSIKILT